jgi:hypothetical protein
VKFLQLPKQSAPPPPFLPNATLATTPQPPLVLPEQVPSPCAVSPAGLVRVSAACAL